MKHKVPLILLFSLCSLVARAEEAQTWSSWVQPAVAPAAMLFPGGGAIVNGAGLIGDCIAGNLDCTEKGQKAAAEETEDPQAKAKPRENQTGNDAAAAAAEAERRRKAEAAVAACEGSSSSMTSTCAPSRVESAAQSLNNRPQGDTANTACGQGGGSSNSAAQGVAGIYSECSSAYTECQRACSAMPDMNGYSDLQSRLGQARSTCATGESRRTAISQASDRIRSEEQTYNNCQRDATNQVNEMNSPPSEEEMRNCSNPAYAAANAICAGKQQVSQPSPAQNNTTTVDGENVAGEYSQGRENIDGRNVAGAPANEDEQTYGTGGLNNEIRPAGVNANAGTGLDNMQSANKAEKNKAPGVAVASLSPKAGWTTGGKFQAKKESGTYNGLSWIPDKIGKEKNEGLPNMDRFRPNLEGFRGPASAAALILAGPILGPGINIWLHMNQKYVDVTPSLNP